MKVVVEAPSPVAAVAARLRLDVPALNRFFAVSIDFVNEPPPSRSAASAVLAAL